MMNNIDDNTKEFLDFLLKNSELTDDQKNQVNSLIIRDLSSHIDQLPNYDKGIDLPEIINLKDGNFVEWHEPRNIVNFLNKFTGTVKGSLKFTTHNWDKLAADKRQNVFKSYDDFEKIYKKSYHRFNIIYRRRNCCKHIWTMADDFLGMNDTIKGWSKYHLKIGYGENVKKWMDLNPQKQPFEMPLSFIQNDLRELPKINGKTLNYFEDVVNVFKHCIEFRDDDLYYMVKRQFRLNDHIVDKEALNTLRGRSFFTDTEIIESVLSIISSNISTRPEFPNVKISCKEDVIHDEKVLCLEIMQEQSFSNRDITDSKIRCENDRGDLGVIKSKLIGLCDFAVESTFRVNGELTPLRLTYLKNVDFKDKNDNGIQKILSDECTGFKYILTFYLYDSDKDPGKIQ